MIISALLAGRFLRTSAWMATVSHESIACFQQACWSSPLACEPEAYGKPRASAHNFV